MERDEPDVVLPPWIDEIVSRRQSMEGRTAAPPPASPWDSPAAPEGPPPTVLEPVSGFARSGPPSPSSAMLAAPPPERTVPRSAEPIPLFDRVGDARRLPPRLRGKLREEVDEDEESEELEAPRRASMAWPIASLVIAAIAIAGLLVVRFGSWQLERRAPAPEGAAPPAASPDSTPREAGPFPPLDGLGESGVGTASTTVPIEGQPPAPARLDPLAPPASAMGGPAPSTPAAPPVSSPPPLSTSGATSRSPASSGAPSVPSGSFGIVVGTFLNETRANAERGRLAEATGHGTRGIALAEDTVTMYRVVVGSFADRASAERAASELVQQGVVTEARVVRIPQPVSTRP